MVIFPVVGLPETSVMTWRFPDTYQLALIVWFDSAETTSSEMLWGLPSARTGTKGVRSRKYVGKSRAPYEDMGLQAVGRIPPVNIVA